jgi:hypothetical protein
MLKAGIAASVLPSALTYQRTWKRTGKLLVPAINPAWITAEYAPMYLHIDFAGKWKWKFSEAPFRYLPNGTKFI